MSSGLAQICACLKNLLNRADSYDDLPERIRIDGVRSPGVQQHLTDLYAVHDEHGLNGVTVRVNDEAVDSSEFNSLIANGEPIRGWQVLISKKAVVEKLLPPTDVATVWFLSSQGFADWLGALDPFGPSSKPLREKPATRVFVYEIAHAFGGPRIAIDDIAGSRIPVDWPQRYDGPDDDSIKRQVHLLASEGTALNPAPFVLSWGDIDSTTASQFRIFSGQVLAACIAQEFYGHTRVVLKGARRLEIPLSDESDVVPTAAQLDAIWKAVRWVYEERPEVRAALMADRLTLDLVNGQSLLAGAARYVDDALKQSIEQYKFVIAERKDVYAKELRELLKDVQQQAILFSDKVRSILNSLLRDVLAALLLISLGLFSRIGRTEEVLASKEADLLFKALAIYLVVSLCLQLLVHLRDLRLSGGELKYWTDATRNQLGMDDIERHLNEPIKARRSSFYSMVLILSMIYLAMAAAAWNFQCVAVAFGVI